MFSDMKKVKEKVRHVLEHYPETRDSDKLLWLSYMERFRGLGEVFGTPEQFVAFKKLMLDPDTPQAESIRRVRQKCQEDGLFLGHHRRSRKEEAEKVREWTRREVCKV